MASEVSAYEAKTHLSALLERVVRGERLTITRHGVPVAILSPLSPQRTGSVAEAVAAIRAFRRGRKLGGEPLRAMVDEGRR